jgi:lysophospholipase L1-like esterase
MINNNDILLFQGDSITDCGRNKEIAEPNNYDALGNGYAKNISYDVLTRYAGLKIKCYNRGISGNKITDLTARWNRDAINLKPDIISILIGVNDTWHGKNHNDGVSVERYAQYYKMLLDFTMQELPDVKLVLCEPFVLLSNLKNWAVSEDWLPEIEARSRIVQQLAKDFDATFVPFRKELDEALKKAPPEYWLGDGVHPTHTGHKLMANAWTKYTGI